MNGAEHSEAEQNLLEALRDHAPGSARYFDEASRLIPRGISSGARSRLLPLTFKSASGAFLQDTDSNTYVDCVMGFGAVLLGHGSQSVIRGVTEQLEVMDIVAGQTEMELELARRLSSWIPCAERVLFSSSGTESVQAALRVARATTGRNLVIRFEGHYHGWISSPHASYAASGQVESASPWPSPNVDPPSSYARIDDELIVEWNDLDAFDSLMKRVGPQTAAVIMEPIPLNAGTFFASEGYLRGVKEVCRKYGALLIFDEVISGFRMGKGGAQEYLGVTPDLATFSKAIASGIPISALVGTEEAMASVVNGHLTHAGTYNANPLSLAAALALTKEIEILGDELYRRLDAVGSRLAIGINALAATYDVPLHANQIGSVLQLSWGASQPVDTYQKLMISKLQKIRLLCERVALHGVYMAPRGLIFVGYSHSDGDIDHVIAAMEEALPAVLED